MSTIFAFQSLTSSLVALVLLAIKIFALVDAALRRADAFEATGKLTKPAWCLILGLSAAAALFFPSIFGLLSIVGTVATFVYLLDVRPALVEVTRR